MKKTIALVAHDSQKLIMAEWANNNREILEQHNLVGTEGTSNIVRKITNLEIKPLGHGPDGGDIIIANEVLQNNIDILIFFIDVRTPHGHEHDIQTLIRMSVLKDLPLALNKRSADLMLSTRKLSEKEK